MDAETLKLFKVKMYFNFTFPYIHSNFLFARALGRRDVIFLFLFNFEGNSEMNTNI